jgi:coenzyme F420-0:L-glutamate ligase / coenzyme F420-1:gamma-L-glutamate ligase
MTFTVFPVAGMPLVRPGEDVGVLLVEAIVREQLGPQDGDILVVCQKIVSKAEGRVVNLADVTASPFARHLAAQTTDKDSRVIEVILGETDRIVKMDRGHLIVETGPGWVCANAGVDESNSLGENTVVLLPRDPDLSARRIVDTVRASTQCQVAVIVTDTFGRPWREGLVDFALGVAGMEPLLDFRGQSDLNGRQLHHTVVAQADALAAAAGLVMRKGDGIPAALIRGYQYERADGGGTKLLRSRELDLFR